LGPFGNFDAGQAFDCDAPPKLVVERREPVVPVHEHQGLEVIAVLCQLLRGPVHVSDDRLGSVDPLPVQLEHQPKHPVGRWVLGADVEHHLLGGKVPLNGGDDVQATAPEEPLLPHLGIS
jgi:hypothetical protein